MPDKYTYWTPVTAFCYERKFKCKNCSENKICEKKKPNNNLGLRANKYAALQTYSNIGLKGYEEALYKIGKPKVRMKDIKLEDIYDT